MILCLRSPAALRALLHAITLALAVACSASLHAAEFKIGDPVEVLWSGTWYKAKVIGLEDGKWRITYDGYSSSWDESVGPDRIRSAATLAPPSGASPQNDKPAASAAPSTAAPATAKPATTPAPPAPTFAFPERPAGKRAGLEGAFLRVESWYFSGRLSLTNQGWFFTKEGRVSLTPSGGFSFADFQKTATAHKSDGVYWIEDDKLTIQWASGAKPSVYDYAAKPDGTITLNGIAATRVEGFERGWRVAAHYEGGASLRGGGSFLASSNSLHFHRDGTFGGESVGSVSTTAGGQSVGGGSSSSTAGTYEFDGYTLTLRHADGRVERRTVFAFSDRDAQGAPEYIWREGTMLTRRDPKN